MPDLPKQFLRVALFVPLRRSFTYSTTQSQAVLKGVRVHVPFGSRNLIGVIVETNAQPESNFKIRAVKSFLDTTPVVDSSLVDLIAWASAYYHHPLGEVWQAALPKQVRTIGTLKDPDLKPIYLIKDSSQLDSLSRAPAQRLLAHHISDSKTGLDAEALATYSKNWKATIRTLLAKNIILESQSIKDCRAQPTPPKPDITLNPHQQQAVDALTLTLGTFTTSLINGVTGSGKTEVYFGVIDAVLKQQKQALVLFPEIALTTQLVARFKLRFGSNVVALHSGLGDTARYQAWYRARSGRAGIVLGTRSAVFTPLLHPALIILDEEHDGSFKQQEGFRYHARSVAIKRAMALQIPVVLGSATPAIETLHNVANKKYQECCLPLRAGKANLPKIDFIDLQQYPTEEGITQPLLRRIEAHLNKKQQILVFINRRGFAPVLFCPACQWQAPCPHCDTTMTLHRSRRSLRCHHCDTVRPQPETCPACKESTLIPLGDGTQRVEETLQARFPEARIQRFDRDELATHKQLEKALDAVHAQTIDILVGTQLLTKGHDFPNVTLVAVINADSGLHSIDFRAPEQLIQQLIQVSGRAGRAELAGQVLIQTHHPSHPYFEALSQHNYLHFAQQILAERQIAALPPSTHLALWRANSVRPQESIQLLRQFARMGQALAVQEVEVFDAVDSPLPRRNGRYRAQLLVRASNRRSLHQLLAQWLIKIETIPAKHTVRWSLDIDPMDLY